MKEKLLFYLQKTINWLEQKHITLSKKTEDEPIPYNSLAPISDADPDGHYFNSLTWALKNKRERDIRNIALTGPYGSGKSSILKTFKRKYLGGDLHFLNISLATFKEEVENKDSSLNNATKEENLSRLIELSILQQIFYHEKDKTIPDSRFKKIKSFKWWQLLLTSVGIVLILISLFILGFPQLFESILKTQFNNSTKNAFHFTALFIFLLGFTTLLYRSIRIINGLKITKLSIQNTEIEISDNISKSILNHHLDEILYFFEATDYNVVIIEDLDRFQQTEIFTKLREINLLLNNSKKTKHKEIVFIYAVRDEMFKDKDRTKFFDFIIPVIPVINSSNSSQKLLELNDSNKLGLSEDLIENISLYIDDMRLLYNITNEFYLYRKNLDENLKADKLLAILTYKNILPNDFAQLSNSQGLLYDAIANKQEYIDSEIERINTAISKNRDNIENLEKLKIKNLQELRALYLLRYIIGIDDSNKFQTFVINNEAVIFNEMLIKENFDYLIQDKAEYNSYNSYNGNTRKTKIALKFNVVEKQVDPTKNYKEREQEIEAWNDNKSETLKKEIQELEREKLKVRDYKIRELIATEYLDLATANEQHYHLIHLLLRNGYIEEDYLDYISIFYEGSISKTDHQFLLSVKSQKRLDFNYKLNKIDKLINKLHLTEFNNEYILNYDLLNFILADKKYDAHKNSIFSKLKDETKVSVDFIDGYIEHGKHYQEFIKVLCNRWIGIWQYVDNKSDLTEDKKYHYLKNIIEHAEVSDIVSISKNSSLIEAIRNDEKFLNIIEDREKLKNTIKALNIKFTHLSFEDSPKELVDYVYDNYYYNINIKMIRSIIEFKGKLDPVAYDTQNYFSIRTSNCLKLLNYINTNINLYVENLYVKIESNLEEDENSLIELLNNKDLKIENKTIIIQKVQTKISSITSIIEPEISNILFKESKLKPIWNNIYKHYETNANQITEEIILYLNGIGNSEELSRTKIQRDAEGERKYTDFTIALITNEEINNSCYALILKSLPYYYTNISVEKLSEEKIHLLILNKTLYLNKVHFDSLKANFDTLHIKLLESRKSDFFSKISEFDVDAEDILLLLKSNVITKEEKNVLIEAIDENLILTHPESLKELGALILSNNNFRITDLILKNILLNTAISNDNRIRIFNIKSNQVTTEVLTEFLNSLGEPYSDIIINGKNPLINPTDYNFKLTEILKQRDYISGINTEDRKGIRIFTFKKPR